MATTMQHCTPSSAANTTAANGAANPQLKRIVYSKYRELLGSYNDKANAIIETLPAYMVREDRGFHCLPATATTQTVAAVDATITTTITPSPMPAISTAAWSQSATAASTNSANSVAAAALLRQVAAAAAANATPGEHLSEML